VQAAYPHLPLFENQGLGVALLSYAGQLNVGITVDWEHGDLLADLIDCLYTEVDAITALASPPTRISRPADLALAG
jgi:hypothetical protein